MIYGPFPSHSLVPFGSSLKILQQQRFRERETEVMQEGSLVLWKEMATSIWF